MNDFYIDKQQTINFYKNYNEICHCSYCENYYKYIEIEYPYLKEYLSKFNIDILNYKINNIDEYFLARVSEIKLRKPKEVK